MKTTERRIQRRNRMLAIAGKVFLEKGYAQTSMAEISSTIGGSKATLYSYFPSKSELFQAFMLYETEQKIPFVFSLPETTTEISETLTELGKRFIDLLSQDTAIALQRIAFHDAVRFPEVGRAFYEYGPKVSNKLLADYIKKAHKNGDLYAPNEQLSASQFIMLCQANDIIQAHLLGMSTQPSTKMKEEVVNAAVTTFMAAYQPK